MAVCPICHTEFESPLPGRLCERCAEEVIARDVYSASNLRFVGILAGVLGSAVLSVPGAFVGFYLGKIFDRATTGCLAGVITFSLAGIVIGYRIGLAACQRAEAARLSRQE